MSAEIDPSVAASIAELRKQFGEKMVRVILTTRGNGDAAVAAAQQKLVSVMKEAGALVADPIPGQPLLVVECSPAQLEIGARTGLISRVEIDRLDAPH